MITTSQYVQIDQTTASVGDRILAQIIDWCVLVGYVVMTSYVFDSLGLDSAWFILIFILLPLFSYSLLMEIFNHGQSLGKAVMNTRVIKADGSVPTIGAFVMRSMLYLVDGPSMGFIGLICMLLNKNNQRLGDMAAGTVVVKLQDYHKIQVSLDEYDFLQKDYKPHYVQAADLSLEQIEIITRTVNVPRTDFAERTAALSAKVQQKLGIRRAEPTDTEFLRRIVSDYQFFAMEAV